MYFEALMREVIGLSTSAIDRPGRAPFAAMITRNGSTVATGLNNVNESMDPTAHGEILAIRAACRTLGQLDLSDCDLYTSCEPCPLCTAAISITKIRHIYYAVGRTQARELLGNPPTHHPPLMRIEQVINDVRSPIDARSAPASQHLETDASHALRVWRENCI